ncbi:PTS glucose transporter subunit IIA [Paenibacillus sp. CGMCC 1.18879]|uniref:PTS sugar transporter subunit IIA n=1 Tax=Paenibacillus sp. CGMCC 1.18879 TaxID=2834466 RepID=UPI001CA804F2|nr:PTS glucose transporter subunit IIA [Paenibacillus sp. CGMCC 1.18879]MBY9077347.1 PTS glucose transporter subunit IIA [Paenibacillus sp. CGMCC 1.18879]
MFGFGKKEEIIKIASPIEGKCIPLSEVLDEAFSSKAMGEGVAIIPDSGKVIAPFDGSIVHIMNKSKHAIIIEHKSKVQLLVHVGMDTVSLKGEGFKAHVETGDKVKKGQLLLEFDMNLISTHGYSLVTPIVVPNGQEHIKKVVVKDDQPELMEEEVIQVYL